MSNGAAYYSRPATQLCANATSRPFVARATDSATGAPLFACGLNISRWENGRLAEEWAVWEPLSEGA